MYLYTQIIYIDTRPIEFETVNLCDEELDEELVSMIGEPETDYTQYVKLNVESDPLLTPESDDCMTEAQDPDSDDDLSTLKNVLLDPSNYIILQTNSWSDEGANEIIITKKTGDNIAIIVKKLQEGMQFKNTAWTMSTQNKRGTSGDHLSQESDDNNNMDIDPNHNKNIDQKQDGEIDEDDDNISSQNSKSNESESQDKNKNDNSSTTKPRKNINYILHSKPDESGPEHFFGTSCGTDAGKYSYNLNKY